jgi:uncharacterized protein YndB with AHSA1/START domain
MTDDVLRMTRRFDVAPERVFDAWVDPALAAKWLFTSPTSESHSTEIDASVGGGWVVTDRRDGVDYKALGEYLQIDRPRRLVFSFGMPQFSDAFNTVTIKVEPDGDGCLMTLTQDNLPTEHHEPTRRGWEEMFHTLAALPNLCL